MIRSPSRMYPQFSVNIRSRYLQKSQAMTFGQEEVPPLNSNPSFCFFTGDSESRLVKGSEHYAADLRDGF